MDVNVNLLEIKVEGADQYNDTIQLTDKLTVKLNYPKFSVIKRATNSTSITDLAFDVIAESVEYIFDGQQYYYAKETAPAEMIEFIESLSQEQFSKIEDFFTNLPKLNKKIEVDCKKCGFHHRIDVEGLESFFV